jgi:hypothetical protein
MLMRSGSRHVRVLTLLISPDRQIAMSEMVLGRAR